MPGKSAHQAVDSFIKPLQLAVSCVSRDVVVHGGKYEINTPCAIQVGKKGAIELRGTRRLALTVKLNYTIIRPGGVYKIHATAYSYSIRDRKDVELLRYDWHPEIDPKIAYPHVHIDDSQLKKYHLPTSRIALEQVLHLLITQFEINPIRQDWETILRNGLRDFERYRSWHSEPGL